ncbi:MAG: hypothetical protein IJ341_02525 [Bacteroidales bacterium]|nr:hypothetical protein [Bacteroidales bacterium]
MFTLGELRAVLPKDELIFVEDKNGEVEISDENNCLETAYNNRYVSKLYSTHFRSAGNEVGISVEIIHSHKENKKRLTIRNSDGTVSQPTATTVEDVFYKLAEYEDIGYTPSELKAIIASYEANE